MIESWIIVIVSAVFGLALGSFLNVCSIRWPLDQSVVRPPSRCPECDARIRWFDNVPVVSWLLLGGRCRSCSAGISFQYPLVELATSLIWGGMFLVHGVDVEAVRGAVFLTLLLGIAASDARFYIIPDQFSVGGTVLGLAFALVAPEIGAIQSLAGAAVGFTLLWGIAWAGEKAFKKEAMGGGDIKMMALIGAFLGVEGTLLSLFLAAVLGAVIFGPISIRTGKLVPFGIFLAAGAAVAYGWGGLLVGWYMDWAFPT